MQDARPIDIDLPIGKARSAARYQEPTDAEATNNTGRPAAITGPMIRMDGGIPIRVDGTLVGAVGVSGLGKANDIKIADAAAAGVK